MLAESGAMMTLSSLHLIQPAVPFIYFQAVLLYVRFFYDIRWLALSQVGFQVAKTHMNDVS